MSQITLKGNPVNTIGTLPAPGSTLANFNLVKNDLTETSLADFNGKKIVLNIFPSIETGICSTSVRKFNEHVAALNNTVVLNVSKDLPYSLKRFCAAEGIENVETLSAFRSSFGEDYGLTMTDSVMKGLLSRAIIVANENCEIIHAQQVPEIAQEPDYEAVLAVL